MIPALYENIHIATSVCSPAALAYPNLFGAEFYDLEATVVTNHSQSVPIGLYTNHGAVNVANVSFCNVTVTHGHPGQNDRILTQVWLPFDTWNGRLQHIGGAGWQAGLHWAGLQGMMGAIGEGYATVGTDAGLGSSSTPKDWALLSEGNVNLYLLQNLATTSLNDASIIAKDLINSFYQRPVGYSYFSGCSRGGRQGFQLAQRYPDAYDGIAASAAAINWNEFLIQSLWPLSLMDEAGYYPPPCEIDAITQAALTACDGLDGIEDGVVTDPENCKFDALSMVGVLIDCDPPRMKRRISKLSAEIVQKTWDGARRPDGSRIWYGPSKGARLTGSITDIAILPVKCSNESKNCSRGSFDLSEDWIRLFLLKNSSASTSDLSEFDLSQLYHLSKQLYDNMLGTNDPDLSAFAAKGGKIVGYHGLTDTIIPAEGSMHYYDAATAANENIQDFFRLFLAPGLNHCFGGNGAYPADTFDALRRWVEKGIAPDTLEASTVNTQRAFKRPLCPYPLRQFYDGKGNATLGEGFSCVPGKATERRGSLVVQG